MKLKTFSVSEINSYIKRILKNDVILNAIRLEGEITNYSLHSNGHIFFSLKDEFSKISCIMFASDAMNLNFKLEEGMNVQINGKIELYSQEGKYQIIASNMLPSGIALAYQNFLLLNEKLNKKGYFDISKKKRIEDIKKVGIITSARGAAIKDFITVLNRRNPFVEIYVYDSLVQGENAPVDIANGIKYFNSAELGVDAIVISRGGGSKEELSAFNSEVVADAIFESKLPILSAVGHEIDVSICDLCADMRVATPTEAAEYVSGDFYLKLDFLSSAVQKLDKSIQDRLGRLSLELEKYNVNMASKLVNSYLEMNELKLKNSYDIMKEKVHGRINLYESDLERANAILLNLNPQNMLKKGYVLVKNKDGVHIMSSEALNAGEDITIKFADGEVRATIY